MIVQIAEQHPEAPISVLLVDLQVAKVQFPTPNKVLQLELLIGLLVGLSDSLGPRIGFLA